MKGRLNLFQLSMLRWRALHPYNAVHVLTIEGGADRARIRDAIAGTLESWGLTGLVLDAAGGRFEYTGGPARFDLAFHGDAPLDPLIEQALNARFPDDGPIEPFRFFAIERQDRFELALYYDHFVAAGDSIVMLLKAIGAHYASGRPGRSAPPERYPPGCARVLARHPLALVAGLRRVPGLVASCRRSVRPRYADPLDGYNAFSRFTLDEAGTAAVRRTAKAAGVTINDVLLALALASVEPLAGARDRSKRRHEIGVASIMNIRHEFGAEAADAFGQFLSSFRVSHPAPRGITIADLARDLQVQSSAVKRERLYLQTLLAIGLSGHYARRMSDLQRATMHNKNYPTWAGISNLDVNALWRRDGGGDAPPYVRAVPTGPLTPIVLAITGTGRSLEIGVSFRTAAVSREQVATMSGLFVELVSRLSA